MLLHHSRYIVHRRLVLSSLLPTINSNVESWCLFNHPDTLGQLRLTNRRERRLVCRNCANARWTPSHFLPPDWHHFISSQKHHVKPRRRYWRPRQSQPKPIAFSPTTRHLQSFGAPDLQVSIGEDEQFVSLPFSHSCNCKSKSIYWHTIILANWT